MLAMLFGCGFRRSELVGTSEDGWVYRNLYIERPLMSALLESLDGRVQEDFTFRSPLVNDTVLARGLARVFARVAEPSSLLENESLLMSVVARLATDHLVPGGYLLRDAGREHAAVRRVKDWLEAHSEQNVSLRVLADVAGLSPYYLVRVFHKQIGIPPHKYQTIVRVHRARKLLASSGAALAEVAFCTGFCDQSHLNRCFKRMFGTTPGDYATSGLHG